MAKREQHKTMTPIQVVEITLDRVRHARLDFNALGAAEEATGLNLLDPESWPRMNAGQLRVLIHAALVWEDPELTLAQVGAMLSMSRFPEITEILVGLTPAREALKAGTLRKNDG